MTRLVHATCVALRPPGTSSGRAWRAVLLRGPSGAGKSDLALRLIEAGISIGTFPVAGESLSVDTAEQLEQARAIAAGLER